MEEQPASVREFDTEEGIWCT